MSPTAARPPVLSTLSTTSRENDIAGKVAFLIYLKSGYALSGIEKIPNANFPPSLALEKFLFQDRELKQLWYWLQSSPTSLFRLPKFKYIYRFPQGYKWSDSEACGKADSGNHTVILLDNCLVMDTPYPDENSTHDDPFMKSSALRVLYHEVGHHYDFTPNRILHSEREDFKKLSGWKVVQYHKQGKLRRDWKAERQDNFMRPYSSGSPREDFADSLAAYRLFPEMLKRIAPQKFAYMRKKVFQGRGFDFAGLERFYHSRVAELVKSGHQKRIVDCPEEEGGRPTLFLLRDKIGRGGKKIWKHNFAWKILRLALFLTGKENAGGCHRPLRR